VAEGLATAGARARSDVRQSTCRARTRPDVVDAMLAAGYLINNTTPRTLRFLPPLVVDAVQIDGLVAALRRTLTALR